MIKVSVIVPVYNVEKFIDECLKSIVNQTLKDIEIIVVNDGSPDNSQKIIDDYVEKYPKIIKSFIKENGGQGSARNLGLDIAKGKYISFVDSDDYIKKNMLEDMYNVAEKDKADIVVCDMKDIYDNGREQYLDCTHYDNIYRLAGSSCNKLFNKKIIGDIRFIGKIWYEDFEFTTKILSSNPKVSCISSAYYICHCGHVSTMNNNNSEKNLDMLIILDNIKKYLIEKGRYSEDVFSYLCFKHILISTMPRVLVQKNKKSKIVLKKLNYYCKLNAKNYWNCPFYKKICFREKIIGFIFYNRLYFIYSIYSIFKKS